MWVRVDDALPDDGRVAATGPAAVGVLVFALCYSNRNKTYGWVPKAILARLCPDATMIDVVVAVGMLTPEDRDGMAGFRIHQDYQQHQLTEEQVEQLRQTRSEVGRIGGISSGIARKTGSLKQTRSKPEANAKQVASKIEAKRSNAEAKTNPDPDPDPDPVMRTPPTPSRGRARADQNGFDAFWDAYPKKQSKGAAWRVWDKLAPDADLLAQIVHAIDWQRQEPEWLKERGKYIPQPAKWLRNECWKNQPSTTPHINERTLATARSGQEFLES